MEWIKYSKYNEPPQGLKILCFKKGDVWIARRINYNGKNYWIEIPFGGKRGCIATEEPDYWMRLDLPEGYSGFLKVGINGGEPLTLDELQSIDHKSYEEFIEMFFNSAQDYRKAPEIEKIHA